MRLLQIQLDDSNHPVYQKIADGVRAVLESNTVQSGELLPSTRQLSQQLQVHRHTVTRALDELVAEGWIEAEAGRGYRVVAQAPEINGAEKKWPSFDLVQNLLPQFDDNFDFPSGKPDLRLFPKEDFFRILRSCLRDFPPEELLGYSEPAGHKDFRVQLKSYLARMRGLRRGQVVVTHGSQESIFLLGQLFAKGSGKKIAVEELGYRPAWDALSLSGSDLVGIPVDDQGLNLDILEHHLQAGDIGLIYLTPLHQYPTTASLSLERRRRLLRLVSEYQVPVIEDDYDHEFHYSGRPLKPLAALDESGLIIYVSTFSKLVYPSSRLGFCLVPDDLLEPICRLKRCVSRQNDLLLQLSMKRWMETGGLDRHLRKMRKLYHKRLQFLSQSLKEMGLPHRVPQGGMSLWVDLGQNYAQIMAKAKELGLNIRPSDHYDLKSDERELTHVRLGFACYSEEEIQTRLSLLAQAIRT